MRVVLKSLVLAAVCVSVVLPLLRAQTKVLAPTPPMGWNSWDAYGTTVTESEVRATADVMARNLKRFGWEYIVVDIQWSEPQPKAHGYRVGAELAMDGYGRLIPAPNRFPSAKDGAGFRELAEYVHGKGLKFGIHIMRGIPRQAVARNLPVLGTVDTHAMEIADTSSTCAWNTDMYGVDVTKPGGQAYYDSLVKMYASWGVDFIKADDMARPYHSAEIAALHRAIVKSGQPIALSLSPGPAPTDRVDDLRGNAQMWRIADDLWDEWKSVKAMYFLMEKWSIFVEPDTRGGHWPDADMLPLGHIGLRAERGEARMSKLTHDEQRTMMTLWSIFRSPLMFGGDLLTLDDWTKSLLTNVEVLAVNQHSSLNRLAFSDGDLRAWVAKGAHGEQYVAVFNLGETKLPVDLLWNLVGWKAASGTMTDLWTGEKSTSEHGVHVELAPHASVLYAVR
ncbi:glycoside hydrolase clan GH-D [Terriglobus saanensis SP1PR4]|uniref:Alpha-galactosidase n=1 Tax=Terriglobus saanensis (strain ATCC BAA-1853 / DSM 23119 / SP1PR4) TaxID=401053 RepID=E8V4L8_TERSS|nr:glycoside hydrolase clan GH-D [Terriglobus saanensis SP1PR4]